jgi:hypothetical protein
MNRSSFKVLHLVFPLPPQTVSSVLVELFLPNSHFLGSHLQQFIVSNVANSLLDGHRFCSDELDFFVMGVGPDVGDLLLLGWIHLYIFLLSMLSYHQPIVYRCPRTNEEGPKLL